MIKQDANGLRIIALPNGAGYITNHGQSVSGTAIPEIFALCDATRWSENFDDEPAAPGVVGRQIFAIKTAVIGGIEFYRAG